MIPTVTGPRGQLFACERHNVSAPAAGCHQREGENQNPTSKEGTDMSIISPDSSYVEPVTTGRMTFAHNPAEGPEDNESWSAASALPVHADSWHIFHEGDAWRVLLPQLEATLDLDALEQLATELETVTTACCDLNAYGRIIAREVTA